MSPRKKSGQPRPAQPKPVNNALTFGDRQINEGTELYAAFTRLSALGARELAGAVSLLDAFTSIGQTAKRLGQMQAQLDRMEGRIIELLRGPAAKAPEAQPQAQPQPKTHPAPPKKAARPSHAARASVAKELAELEETVEERQARMAKMEREEKRKNIAQQKKLEKLKAKQEQEAAVEPPAEEKPAGHEKPVPKKKPRRRRKPAKKEEAMAAAETAETS